MILWQLNLAAASSDKVDVYWLEIEPTSVVTLLPPLVTNSNSFFAATVTPGAIALTPALFTNSNTFYAHTVSQSGATQTLTAARFDNTSTFNTHAITLGAVTLSPALFTNSNTFFGGAVSQNGAPQTLTASLFTNTNSFFTATVGVGAVTLSPTLVASSNAFYSHTLSQGGGTQTLSPPFFSSVPYNANPALLLHMDGTNGSTVVVDDSNYSASITNINNATLTTSDKKFGTASLDMNRGLTINGDIERFKFAGDYTIDMQVKITAWANLTLFGMTDGPGFSKYVFGINAQGGLQLSSAYVSTSTSKSADAIMPTNDWAHVQIARSGNTTRIWLNGTVVSTFSEIGSYAAGSVGIARVQVGEYFGNSPFVGKMDEVRVLSGVAANTGNFTAPTAPYSLSTEAFFPATLTVGAVTLTPSLFTNSNSFYTHTLTAAAPSQTLTASLFTNSNSFYSHTAVTTITLLPALLSNDNSFYSHTVSTSGTILEASLYTNINTFFGGALFTANLADDFNRSRVVYIPADNTAQGAAQNINRTVYVVEEAVPSAVVVSSSRTAYVPAEYV